MNNYIKKYWIGLLLLLGVGSIGGLVYFSYDPYYCSKKNRALKENEIPIPINDLIYSIASTHGLAKKIVVMNHGYDETVFDKKDIQNISSNVSKYFQKHPEYIYKGHYKKDFLDRSEVYSVTLIYFYSDDEIDKVNNYLQQHWGNRPKKKIIGTSYWQSYSACGSPTFGMQDDIYDGDEISFRKPTFKNKN